MRLFDDIVIEAMMQSTDGMTERRSMQRKRGVFEDRGPVCSRTEGGKRFVIERQTDYGECTAAQFFYLVDSGDLRTSVVTRRQWEEEDANGRASVARSEPVRVSVDAQRDTARLVRSGTSGPTIRVADFVRNALEGMFDLED